MSAEDFENALKLITCRKPFRYNDSIRSYQGSAPGSPVQPATPPRNEFDFCKNPELLAMIMEARKAKFEITKRPDFVKFCERVVNAGVRSDPSKKKKSNRKSSSDSSNYN